VKYKSITIENFRGISHLELTDLKDFNLIVGRNNCGKTSVLEAMFLLSGMANPGLVASVNGFRGMIPSSEIDLSSIFKNLDFHANIQLRGRIDTESGDRRLLITQSFGYNSLFDTVQQTEIEGRLVLPPAVNIPTYDNVNFDFVTHKNEEFHSTYSLKTGKTFFPENYREDLLCTFLNPEDIKNADNAENMDNLIINKKVSSIITVLKLIDPAIKDISMGSKSIYFDIGAPRLVPINVMGDGLRKILDLLVAIAATKDGVLLIDEIENGLHYSSLSILWKAVFAACAEYNVQIIATTHSYECVENFSKMYDSVKKDDDNIRLFRIDKQGENHKAYSYSADVLKAGIEKEFEVR
jgi:AAA15 family ATPase/GTPase